MFCLDTVTVAKLMEGTGQAMQVQASNDIKTILDSFGTFEFEYRGAVEGHNGAVVSWWLLNEREPSIALETTPVKSETSATIEDVQSSLINELISEPTA